MKILKNGILKRIVIILSVFITLTLFCISPVAHASKVKMGDDEFYYAGTTEGQYVVSENIFEWLLSKLGDIADFLIGLMTMGGRMVFVGWTALFEELLTWTLEATLGIPLDIENNVNATQVDGLISSSNNITIEAIVYNRVPVLNINLFDNKVPSCVSGTGRYFIVCETCFNDPNNNPGAQTNPSTTKKAEAKFCKMKECTCDNCRKQLAEKGYLVATYDADGNVTGWETDDNGEPKRTTNAITVIKDSVSKWYQIMRLISIAAMLCVLIAVGIKMAITTVASEKAVYKRMLVDWVVGMILIFSIHYFMVVIINFNEVFVEFIRDSENKTVTELTKKELYLTGKSNEDLEIGIYEAVRTRAYDPKLINGTSGMVMYVTLVFYTVRFTLTYLKRYLNIIILTLLAPGVAFSYAIQKVMTGKSQAFSNWLNDYFINTFIQTIHALIYTIFVTTALILSLNSIAGIIMAFVFMNFMLKADDIFRKIFKLTSASTDEAINAVSSAKEMIHSAKSAATFMTAGSLLKKSPITKAVAAPLKMAGTGAVLAAVNLKSKIDEKNTDKTLEEAEEKSEKLEETAKKLQEWRKELNEINQGYGVKESDPKKDFKDWLENYENGKVETIDENGEEIIEKDAVGLDGEDAIDKEMADLEGLAYAAAMRDENAKNIYEELMKERSKFDDLTNISTKDVAKAHLSEFLDKKNYYNYDASTGTYKLKYPMFGKREFDRTQNKWVRHSASELIAEQLRPENLLGFTDDDKKLFKEIWGFAKGTIIGMGSLFVGLGTVVANPGVGMGLLATGINSQINFIEKTGIADPNRVYRPPVVSEKHKKFSFNRFNKGAKQTIAATILAKAEGEKDRVVVENVRKNHRKLYAALKVGGAVVTAAGVGAMVMGAGAIAPIIMVTGQVGRQTGKGIQRYSGYSQNSLFGKINKQHFKQLKELKKELVQDEVRLLSEEEKLEMKNTYQELITTLEQSLVVQSSLDENISDQERKEKEELALQAGDAVKTESGEVIVLDSSNEKSDKEIIKDAVAKVIVTKITNKDFDLRSIQTGSAETKVKAIFEEDKDNARTDAKAIVEEKLIAAGVLQKGEKIEHKIKDIDEQISKQVGIILDEERHIALENIRDEQTRILDNSQDVSEGTQPYSSVNDSKQPRKKMSAIEKVMMQEVIKENVQNGQIKKSSDITNQMIINGVKEKKAAFASVMSSNDVVAKLAGGKTPDITYAQQAAVSQTSLGLLQREIMQIRDSNASPLPKTEKDRREEKKRRIKALDSILIAAAKNEETIVDSENKEVKKSTDEVLQELFANTAEREKAYVMIESINKNMNNIKRLNIRGDNADMKTRNSNYHEEKRKATRRKAFEKYPDLVSEEAKQEDLTSHKETYGPVTDIVGFIRDMSEKENVNYQNINYKNYKKINYQNNKNEENDDEDDNDEQNEK